MTTVLWLYLHVYIVNNVKYDYLSTCFDYTIRSDKLIERVNRESILFFKQIPNTTIHHPRQVKVRKLTRRRVKIW